MMIHGTFRRTLLNKFVMTMVTIAHEQHAKWIINYGGSDLLIHDGSGQVNSMCCKREGAQRSILSYYNLIFISVKSIAITCQKVDMR